MTEHGSTLTIVVDAEDQWLTDAERLDLCRLYQRALALTGAANISLPEMLVALLEVHVAELEGEGEALRDE